MKTDKFDEAIRRKLESIEPAFRERDWGHMQSFMHRHGYPPAWTGATTWLMPLAAAAAVTGVLLSTIWQFHTNQELRQSIQTLSQTVARLETTQSQLIQSKTKKDTVYVTTFTQPVASPSANQVATSQPVLTGNSAIRSTGILPVQTQRRERISPTDTRMSLEPGLPNITDSKADARRFPVTRRRTDGSLATNVPVDESLLSTPPVPSTRTGASGIASPESTPDVTIRSGSAAMPHRDAVAKVNSSADNPVATATHLTTAHAVITDRTEPQPAGQREAGQREAGQRNAGQRLVGQGSESDRIPSSGKRNAGQFITQSGQRSGQPSALPLTEATEPMARQSVSIPLLTGRPLQLDSAYYVEGIARRIRRIRSLFPATTATPTTVAQAMPTEAASSRPLPGGIRVRLGATGELGSVQTVIGLYSEVLAGRHWSLGIGLDHVDLQGGHFTTDQQFDDKTAHDFRREYAPGIDPRHDILDINRQMTLWQIPVNLTYRVPLPGGFALLPSAGVNFVVATRGTITFTYRRSPREFYNASVTPPAPPNSLFTSYVVAAGLEKSWRHLVFQAGPVLTTPAKKLPDPVNPVSLGLRARVLFQF